MAELRRLHSGEPRHVAGYRLLGGLGDGGQGSVFLGRDADGGHAAVKVLHARLTGNDRARRRFLQESATAARVAGFCTAKVLGSGLVEGRPYIVSEFIDGPSLHERVLAGGPLSGGELERLAVGTITALTAIHGAGIVHRDFKPSNILMGPDGPRVIDFGIAKAMDASTTASSVVGTPGYMAPEQIAGESATAATDLFSWASSIGFAATGEPLFGRDSIPAVMNRILHAEPDVSVVAEPLRSVLESCLAKNPAARPSADHALKRLLGHKPPQPTTVPPATSPEAPPTASPAVPRAAVPRIASPAGPPAAVPRIASPAAPPTAAPPAVASPAAAPPTRRPSTQRPPRQRVPSTGARSQEAASPGDGSRGAGRREAGGEPAEAQMGIGGTGLRRRRWAVAGVGALVAAGAVTGVLWRGTGTLATGPGTGTSAADGTATFGTELGPAFGPQSGANVTAMAIGHDKGRPVVAYADESSNSIMVWDPRAGKLVGSLAGRGGRPVLSMALTTLGGRQTVLWTGGDGILRRWRIGDAKQGAYNGVCQADARMALGSWLDQPVAVIGCPDGQVKTINLASNERVGETRQVSGEVTALAWDERSGRPLVGTDHGLLGSSAGTIGKGRVSSVSVLGDGLAAITTGASTSVYDLTDGRLVRGFSTGGASMGVTAAGGRRMIAGGADGVTVWNADRGEKLGRLLSAGTKATTLALGDGLLVAVVNGELRAWSLTGNS
ncbi:hypothetical protein GCM10022419_069590 [Nonomuraea rosea]|uniref:Protein kinase domain-containing protein n=1 Tax=Nonomuraea rosea TaxID=638574 RepID=A0ABP6Y8Y6_9ACTN